MSLKFITPAFTFIILSKLVFAHCPLCVAATGGAVVAARFYGVPDLVIGTFIGAYLISISFWINKILLKRNKGRNYLPFQQTILIGFWLFLFLILLTITNITTLSIFNKLIEGMLIGTFVTLFAFKFHDFLREKNRNRNYIPLQVIFIALTFLLLTTFTYYIIGMI